jgi:hypothetical protein
MDIGRGEMEHRRGVHALAEHSAMVSTVAELVPCRKSSGRGSWRSRIAAPSTGRSRPRS